MRIAILTVNYSNYGSFFQAVALYRKLEDMGHKCEFVNEFIGKQTLGHRLGSIADNYFPKWLIRLFSHFSQTFKIYHLAESALKKYRISPKFSSFSEIEDRYDCLLIGSDELWSINSPYIRFIDEYYGLNVHIPVISYATSGISAHDLTQTQKEKVRIGLQRFISISVRDNYTKEWIQRVTDIVARTDIDPTLLFPFFQTSHHSITGQNAYILVYGERFSDNEIDDILKYAQKNKYKLLSLGWHHKWCDRPCVVYDINELPNVFAGASYVFSSTFHGTVFSILQHCNFCSFLSDFRSRKIQELLELVGLSSRIYHNRIVTDSIDYIEVEKKIQELRKDSSQYLKEALKKVYETMS